MTVATISNTTWSFTCKICNVIRNIAIGAFIGMVAFGETAGRARAASELSRMGLHDEAKALMTSPKDYS